MDLNLDQIALQKWITAGLAIKEVRDMHGDARYLLSNMIAKVTLASSKYYLSESAFKRLNHDGFDLNNVYKRSKFHGKKSPFIYEHSIPASIVRTKLLSIPPIESEVKKVLSLAGHVAMILREEDALLRTHGLTKKMPDGWEWSDDPFARYHIAGIKLAEQKILMEGAIMR